MTRNAVRIELKFKNNFILSMMEERGITSVAKLAGQVDCERNAIYRLVSMKLSARTDDGAWRPAALVLAEFFQCMPEDLFSEEQQETALETNRATAEIGFAEIQLLTSRTMKEMRPDQIAEAAELKCLVHQSLLKQLSHREHRVVALYFGLSGQKEHTLEEIGEQFLIGHKRIHQILSKALRKLKHPSVSSRLRRASGYAWKVYDDRSDPFDVGLLGAMHHL